MEDLKRFLREKELELCELEKDTDKDNVLEMLLLVRLRAYVEGVRDSLEIIKEEAWW